jgi:hypothetical protein
VHWGCYYATALELEVDPQRRRIPFGNSAFRNSATLVLPNRSNTCARRVEKRVPTKTILEAVGSLWFPALRLRFCARALRASGLTWLWPRMALAILTMCA